MPPVSNDKCALKLAPSPGSVKYLDLHFTSLTHLNNFIQYIPTGPVGMDWVTSNHQPRPPPPPPIAGSQVFIFDRFLGKSPENDKTK